jgi:hypothetical protein
MDRTRWIKDESSVSLLDRIWQSNSKGSSDPVKWLMMAVFIGLMVTGLAWSTTATPPYTQIVIEDESP